MKYILSIGFILFSVLASADVPMTLRIKDHQYEITPTKKRVPRDYSQLQTMDQIKEEIQKDLIEAEKMKVYEIAMQFFSSKDIKLARQTVEFRNYLEKNYKAIEAQYIPELKKYFDQVLVRNGGRKFRDGKSTVYQIPNGVAFIADFFSFKGQPDPRFQAIASTLITSYSQRIQAQGIDKVLLPLRVENFARTYLFSAKEFTEEDMKLIAEIGLGKGEKYFRIGDVWVIGGGFSYLITKSIIKKGSELKDPVLKARFDRIIRYHISSMTPVISDYKQGAAAYFNPNSGEMSFSIPSTGTLNAYTHEMTHSRFNQFTEQLKKWTAKNNYIMPYHVSGPSMGGFAELFGNLGGLYNLLNEVNSWRIGESFDGKNSDEDILKILKESYGPQAGYEATEMLETIWTKEKLAGKSIPYLIYNEIKKFNKMTPEEILMMGFEGVETNNFIKKMNFLIMLQSGRLNDKGLDKDLDYVKNRIAETSQEKSILELLNITQPAEEKKVTKDLKEANLAEVLDVFVQTGSKQATELLIEKFLNDLKPEHVDALIQRFTQVKSAFLTHEAEEVLEALLNRLEIKEVVDSENKNKIRDPVQLTDWLKAFDLALSKRIYDGSLASPKYDLFNFMLKRFHPEELPLTKNLTIDHIAHAKDRKIPDISLARLTLMPKELYTVNVILWTESVIRGTRNFNLTPRMKEMIGLSYAQTMKDLINYQGRIYEEKWSDVSQPEKIRALALRDLSHMPDSLKNRLDYASAHLWELAGDENSSVRTSALYAMISTPFYLIRNEGRLMKALYDKDPKYEQAIHFLMDSMPTYLPKAHRIFKIQEEKRTLIGLSCRSLFVL